METLGKIEIGQTAWAVTSDWSNKYSYMSTNVVEVKVNDITSITSKARGTTRQEIDVVALDYSERLDGAIDGVFETKELADAYAAVRETSNTYETDSVESVFKRTLGLRLVANLSSLDTKGLKSYQQLNKEFAATKTEEEQYTVLAKLMV